MAAMAAPSHFMAINDDDDLLIVTNDETLINTDSDGRSAAPAPWPGMLM